MTIQCKLFAIHLTWHHTSTTNQTTMQAGQIFFSYSRADAAFALKLGEDLKKAGVDIWIDHTA